MFDLLLLVAVLAAFLSFIPAEIHDITDMENWGFTRRDDKTMKNLAGDGESGGYGTDAYTAAEVVLATRVADYPALNVNDYVLPDGSVVSVDLEYKTLKNEYTNMARTAVSSDRLYRFVFDYDADIWRIIYD
jgi:hypothetical protein